MLASLHASVGELRPVTFRETDDAADQDAGTGELDEDEEERDLLRVLARLVKRALRADGDGEARRPPSRWRWR